jgi:hypothetical protein
MLERIGQGALKNEIKTTHLPAHFFVIIFAWGITT